MFPAAFRKGQVGQLSRQVKTLRGQIDRRRIGFRTGQFLLLPIGDGARSGEDCRLASPCGARLLSIRSQAVPMKAEITPRDGPPIALLSPRSVPWSVQNLESNDQYVL